MKIMKYGNIVLVLIGVLLVQCSAGFFLSGLKKLFDAKSGMDVFCLITHCGTEATACLESSQCRQNMECMTKCGMKNHTCMYGCLNTYEEDVFDKFMECAVTENHCMELEPPNPNFRCKPPAYAIKNFTLSELEGPWYIAIGLNRDYDCFDCQISTYAPSTTSSNYTLQEKYDVTMLNGSIRHRVTTQQVEQKSKENGGMLDYTDTLMGLTMYEKWQILDVSPTGDYVIVYYCGHMASNWYYEGTLVYSKTPDINPAHSNRVASVLKAYTGHGIQDFCFPKTHGCLS